LAPMDALNPDSGDTGCTDLGYHELYTRWLQFAAFLPMFRSHGTDAPREIWRFGEEGNDFYDSIAKFIKLRYQLMPYIYSMAAQVSLLGLSMIRPVALEFPNDRATHELLDQYFFGPALMVCPVTVPMYFLKNSTAAPAAPKARQVYLPNACAWYDFWTEELYAGGQTISAAAPLNIIPLFVRAGSIIPMSLVMQHVDEFPAAPYEFRIYCGADAECLLYEDAGDTYDYESGAYAIIKLRWYEAHHQLLIAPREGGFPGMVLSRTYRLIFISEKGRHEMEIMYSGHEIILNPV